MYIICPIVFAVVIHAYFDGELRSARLALGGCLGACRCECVIQLRLYGEGLDNLAAVWSRLAQVDVSDSLRHPQGRCVRLRQVGIAGR